MFKVKKFEYNNLKTIDEFVEKWSIIDSPSTKIAFDYKPFCKDLLYYDEELVYQVLNILKKNIELWTTVNSKIYKNVQEHTSKHNLMNKSDWFVDKIKDEFRQMSTSGSTSGNPFSYLAWKPFFEFIEAENHYDLILDEFDIIQEPHILCFFGNNFDYKNEIIYATKNTDNFLHKHGLSRKSIVHHVNMSFYKENQEKFFKYLFQYLKNNEIDVFFAPGPEINSLCHFIRKLNFRGSIAKLLSNSNEMLLHKDVKFLLAGNFVNNICDHMRCWDGGATFFTCRDQNYHLCDNLSWSEEIDNKLITTDYFSFPSPFFKYWNGDLCKINDKYQRCSCGRLYRDFEFLESRPFSVKGQSIEKYKNQIIKSGIKCIKQVKCSTSQIEIVTTSLLSEVEKQIVLGILEKFQVKFTVEEETSKQKITYKLNKQPCGNIIAECVSDKSDDTGNTLIWELDKDLVLNNDCFPEIEVNGKPCVFEGSKIQIPCYKNHK